MKIKGNAGKGNCHGIVYIGQEIKKIRKDFSVVLHAFPSDYTRDGRLKEDDMVPTIFPNKFEHYTEESAYGKPPKPPTLAVDTKVVVWNDSYMERLHAHFAQFCKSGLIICFGRGTTSFTENDYLGGPEKEHWDNYEIYKETENGTI